MPEGLQPPVQPLFPAGGDGLAGLRPPDQPQLGPQAQLPVPREVVQHRPDPLLGQRLPHQELVHIAEEDIAVALALHGQTGGAERGPVRCQDEGGLPLGLEAPGPGPGGAGHRHSRRRGVHPHGAQEGHIPHLPGLGQSGAAREEQAQGRRRGQERSAGPAAPNMGVSHF